MTSSQGRDELADAIAGSSLARAMETVRSRGPVDLDAIDALLDVASGAVASAPALAALSLDLVDRLAAEAGAHHGAPTADYLRARLALTEGRPEEALHLIERARTGWEALGRPLDAFRTELGRMHVLDDLGRHEEAGRAARALTASLERVDGDIVDDGEREQLRWMLAASKENLGVASGFTGHHDEALAAYEAAEQVYRSIGGLEDLARCRANRGVELVAVGRALEGLDTLLSAAAMFEEAGNRLSHAQSLGHAAEAELLLGLHAACLNRAQEAGRLLDELGATTEAHRLRLRTVRAYLALNLADEAAVLAGEAERSFADAGLTHDLAEARWLGGVAALRCGRGPDALELLHRAIEGADVVDDSALGARALLASSEALLALERRVEAVAAAQLAVDTVAGGAWPVDEFHARLQLAQLLDDQEEVERHLDRAIVLADSLDLPQIRYPLLVQLGRRDRERGDHSAARRRLEEAIDIVEGLRGLIPDEMLRTSYLEGRTAAHTDLISMLLDGPAPEQATAFDLAEASKSRTLDDLMAGVIRPKRHRGLIDDPTLANYEADLQAAYSALTTGSVQRTRSQREALQARAVKLERAIRLAHLQGEVGGSVPKTVSPPRGTRPRPGPAEQVAEYHVVGDRIVIFVWRHGHLHVVDAAAGTDEVLARTAAWERSRQRYELARGLGAGNTAGLVDAADDTLRSLGEALVGPMIPLLDDGGDLLIVPHGALHAVPFHALPGPAGPLGRSRTVSYGPSYRVASLLADRSWRDDVGRSVVVGVADEAAPAVTAEAIDAAERLPGAELLLGCRATAGELLAATARPVDVLHMACHGLHRSRNPMFSALRLSDRWLTAHDVLGMTVPGALVVLSACESGRQDPGAHPDETIGLARAFVAAGAAAVIVSLWITDDRATAELMRHFYQALPDSSPATALRLAQDRVATHHPHPADWASFVIHGGGRGRT